MDEVRTAARVHGSHEAIGLLPGGTLLRARSTAPPRAPRTRDVAPAPVAAGSD